MSARRQAALERIQAIGDPPTTVLAVSRDLPPPTRQGVQWELWIDKGDNRKRVVPLGDYTLDDPGLSETQARHFHEMAVQTIHEGTVTLVRVTREVVT